VGLSPEERRKIYEEEKARIEAEPQQEMAEGDLTTGLKPNVAGLLCYLGTWITGIIFLIIEHKSRFVRYHAIQSIIVFGILTIASALIGWIPFIGIFFRAVIGIFAFILWVVLMVKAYQGELYKVPVAGDIAEGVLPAADKVAGKPAGAGEERAAAPERPPETPRAEGQPERVKRRMEDYFSDSRSTRIAASVWAVIWSIILLVFFSFYHQYIAYYHPVTSGDVTTWTKIPLLTSGYFGWLPILMTTLILSVIGYVFLIIYDRYILRQSVLVLLNLFGVATVLTLLSIFPFDFSAIPNASVANVLPPLVTIVLIIIAIGLVIGILVMLIKLIVNVINLGRQSAV